jgi:transposase
MLSTRRIEICEYESAASKTMARVDLDILIRGGQVFDGSGSAGIASDVAIDAGRIAAIRVPACGRPRNDGLDGPRRHHRCQTGDVDSLQQRGPSMTGISMIGVDLAKNVFQVHGVDAAGKVVVRRQLRRGQMEKFFAALPPGVVVGMEACGGAHHWGRVVRKLGHEARLMPAAYVKPYVKRNKNDGRDAEGVCEAMGRPTMRFVPVKSVESQAVLVLHRTRRLLVRQRTMSANAFRPALAEFGIVAAQGLKGLRSLMEALEDPASAIPDQARMPLGCWHGTGKG